MVSVSCTYNTHKYEQYGIYSDGIRPVHIHMYFVRIYVQRYVYMCIGVRILYVLYVLIRPIRKTYNTYKIIRTNIRTYVHKNTYNYTYRIRTITESRSQYVHIRTCKTADVSGSESVEVCIAMPRRKKLGREGGREGDRHKTERVNEKAVCRWGGGGGGEGGKEGGRERGNATLVPSSSGCSNLATPEKPIHSAGAPATSPLGLWGFGL